ncbi:hypothetical protein Dform_00848 [Dehalogenimonas formicexedens]|uniref:Uncharacterized protein n=1 Tax=Dehalogenimonas formicexedens TaxID=1839801 RepID=A0A1P8F6V5_9CHLR|nr:hypothetical protein [Dehalogenimonas formicexedens]APV44193.1 hypothetical protein Dform_00848 [Dehalogenimonas formicexedens]
MKTGETILLIGGGALAAYMLIPKAKEETDKALSGLGGGSTMIDLSGLLGGLNLGGGSGSGGLGGLTGGLGGGLNGLLDQLTGYVDDAIKGVTDATNTALTDAGKGTDNAFKGILDLITGLTDKVTNIKLPGGDGPTQNDDGTTIVNRDWGLIAKDIGSGVISAGIGIAGTYGAIKLIPPIATGGGAVIKATGNFASDLISAARGPLSTATERGLLNLGRGFSLAGGALGAPAAFTVPTVLAGAGAFAGGYGLGTLFVEHTSAGQAMTAWSGRQGAATAAAVNNGSANWLQSTIGRAAGWNVAQATPEAYAIVANKEKMDNYNAANGTNFNFGGVNVSQIASTPALTPTQSAQVVADWKKSHGGSF